MQSNFVDVHNTASTMPNWHLWQCTCIRTCVIPKKWSILTYLVHREQAARNGDRSMCTTKNVLKDILFCRQALQHGYKWWQSAVERQHDRITSLESCLSWLRIWWQLEFSTTAVISLTMSSLVRYTTTRDVPDSNFWNLTGDRPVRHICLDLHTQIHPTPRPQLDLVNNVSVTLKGTLTNFISKTLQSLNP